MKSERAVCELVPDMARIAGLPGVLGVIVTAEGSAPHDIVSRYFAPIKGIPEDPVTGAAHCALAHFWSERLGRKELMARQASARVGEMGVRLLGERVELDGGCVFCP